MTEINPELTLTLDDAVAEVLGMLTGIDLTYVPEADRYRSVARQLNRALRNNALEHEWSYYSTLAETEPIVAGLNGVELGATLRPRQTGDDACRLVDTDGVVREWAYFLPRDAIHKYQGRSGGLWCTATRSALLFSRSFYDYEEGWTIHVPVMREPELFRLPATGETVPDETREQPVDFSYPDVITMRAAYYVALTDPVMQPRAQTLEAAYKDLMYQVIERDDRSTDSPYVNDFFVPVQSGLVSEGLDHAHPHADERRWG